MLQELALDSNRSELKETTINTTLDYEGFKFIQGNRPIDPKHVKALANKMARKDLLIPITVNPQMEVIDGQHRLLARKMLNLPVPYYIADDFGLKEVQAINSGQKSWSIKDYVESYVSLGKKEYEVYKKFQEKYKLPHTITVNLLMEYNHRNRNPIAANFKEGRLTVQNLEKATDIGEKIKRLSQVFKHATDRSFILALLNTLSKSAFNFDKFINKIEMFPRNLQRCATQNQYVDLIEEIYNYRSKEPVSLKYGK